MRIVQAHVAALTLAIAGLAAAGAAVPARAQTSSSAYGLSAALTSQGTGTSIPAVAKTSGQGQAAYTHHSSVLMFSEAMGLVSKGEVIGEMAIMASGIATHASGSGAANATVQTEADASIASVDVTMQLFPTSVAAPLTVPLLALSVAQIATSLTDTQTLPAVAVQTGTVSFGSLTLTGSLVGNKKLTFTGTAPANTVLYDDPNLTVTLNQQIVTGSIDCTPLCQFVPQAITTSAVAIQMHNEIIAGKKATSDVFIGQLEAQLP
jgi:hypothetical protein